VDSTFSINHIALLVPSAQTASNYLSGLGYRPGPVELWEGESTKEIYFEKEMGASLLLMEPLNDGAYQRAMKKRGPGLHHIGVDVLDLEFAVQLAQFAGWSLHPQSEHSMPKSETAWLFTKGFPLLVELQKQNSLNTDSMFIEKVKLKLPADSEALLAAVGLDEFILDTENKLELNTKGHSITLNPLL
jgi:hypothetical protein